MPSSRKSRPHVVSGALGRISAWANEARGNRCALILLAVAPFVAQGLKSTALFVTSVQSFIVRPLVLGLRPFLLSQTIWRDNGV